MSGKDRLGAARAQAYAEAGADLAERLRETERLLRMMACGEIRVRKADLLGAAEALRRNAREAEGLA